MPSIEAYLNVKTAGQPVYHPTGQELTFISNATGLPQIWYVVPLQDSFSSKQQPIPSTAREIKKTNR